MKRVLQTDVARVTKLTLTARTHPVNFGRGRQIQGTNEARRWYPLAECRHRSGEVIGEEASSITPGACSSCFWRRCCPSHFDQGRFHTSRQMIRPGLKHSQDKMADERDRVDLGILYADVCEALMRERMERGQASSGSRSAMR